MTKTFSDCICKNIDQIADAARHGGQKAVEQKLDQLFAFNERINGRSGLDDRLPNE